jgi:hypothetical protein
MKGETMTSFPLEIRFGTRTSGYVIKLDNEHEALLLCAQCSENTAAIKRAIVADRSVQCPELQAVAIDLNRRVDNDEILVYCYSAFEDSEHAVFGIAHKSNDYQFRVSCNGNLAFIHDAETTPFVIRWVRKFNFDAPPELLYEKK